MLISTASPSTWVILPGGCPLGIPGTSPSLTCSESRGGLFRPSQSVTWSDLGNYSLGIEANLGYNDPGKYGLDTLALNFSGGPTLNSQIVAGIQTFDYYTGIFGLSSHPINLSNQPINLSNPPANYSTYPSFLTSLKSLNLIPSLSWAYTAGAPYRE